MEADYEQIFVQIPSYKDTQLVKTVDDLMANAYNKERLIIHVCWQHDAKEKLPKRILLNKNINIIDINYLDSKGANWARSILQKNWNNEPYSFLIDSHMRFVKNWDKMLIKMMTTLKKDGVKKPVLSCLPPSFTNPATFPLDRLEYPGIIYAKEYQNNLLTRFHAISIPHYKWVKAPIPARFIAMGFLFTEGYFNTEIPVDPNIYFFGDDITTALRAYTRGYDLFHPHRIVAWHLYDRKTRTPHWDDHNDWVNMDIKSYERVSRILRGSVPDEYGKMGSERTIAAYEQHINSRLIKE